MAKKQNKKEMSIPEYVTLCQKYNCEKCKLNRKNARYHHKYPQKLKYIFSKCSGEPQKRTQCPKRYGVFSSLFSLLTAAIIVGAFLIIYHYHNDILLSVMLTVIFGVGIDIVCCIIEWIVDKIFERHEKSRRKKYEKKLEDFKAIEMSKKEEEERQKKAEKTLYKDINAAKELVSSFSKFSEKLKEISEESDKFKDYEKNLSQTYQTLLESLENLLMEVNLETFYFPEIKKLFQLRLPYLMQYITTYIEHVKTDKVSAKEIYELTKLVETFNIQAIDILEKLKSSDAENLVYKMQALREVIRCRQEAEEE